MDLITKTPVKNNLKFIFLFILLGIKLNIVYSQTPVIEYSTIWHGKNTSSDIPSYIEQIGDTIYVIGQAGGSAFNPADYPSLKNNPKGNDDIYLCKFHKDGSLISSYLLGSSENETLFRVIREGNYFYLFGNSFGINYPRTHGAVKQGFQQTFITKIDFSANIIYSYIAASLAPREIDIEVKNGEVFALIGTNASYEPIKGGYSYQGSWDYYSYSLDNDGSLKWSSYIGTTNYDQITSGSINVNNNYIFIKGRTSSSNLEPLTDNSPRFTNSDIFQTVFTKNGTLVSSKFLFGVFSPLSITTKNQFIANDKLYAFAVITDTDKTKVSPLNGSQYLGGIRDIIFTVTDKDGNILINKFLGGNNTDYLEVAANYNNSIYLLGTTSSSSFQGLTNAAKGDFDIFATKLDLNGDVLETKLFGGSNREGAIFNRPIDITFENEKMVIPYAAESQDFQTTDGSSLTSAVDPQQAVLVVDTSFNIIQNTILRTKSAFIRAIDLKENKLLLAGNLNFSTDFATTDQTDIFNDNDFDNFLTIYDLSPAKFVDIIDTLSPKNQIVCQYATAQEIIGQNNIIPSDSLALLYVNGSSSTQNQISGIYQWQVTDNLTSPWTDLKIGILKDFLPSVGNKTLYYRRVTYSIDGLNILSISDTATVTVNSFVAPEIDAGGLFTTCPNSSITLGGAPTASGGLTPYTFTWDQGVNNTANPTVAPSESTIYTLEVIDANNCRQLDQAVINVIQADAGPDVAFCEGDSTQILTTPIPGIASTNYSWTGPGLSCNNCIRPKAYNISNTDYFLEITIPKSTGGTCIVRDTVAAILIDAPQNNFAGRDTVICFGGSAQLGTTATLGGPIQIDAIFNGFSGTESTVYDNDFSTGISETSFFDDITFDLGTEYEINAIAIAALNNSADLDGCLIYIGNSTSRFSNTYLGTISSFGNTNTTSTTTLNIGSAKGRYIQIVSLGSLANISEIQFLQNKYSYTWAPGRYLNADNLSEVTYDPGTLSFPPTPDSAVYYVTAEKNGCVFTDAVTVSVIHADAGIDGCGPRTIGKDVDVLELDETFSWTKISGGGTILGSTSENITTVSASPTGSPSTYRLTTSYRGTSCVDFVFVPDCGCQVDIIVDSEINCPNTDYGDVFLRAIPIGGDSSEYFFSWSPAIGLSNTNTARVKLTDNVQRTYTVTITSKIDASFSCSTDTLVNSPLMQAPEFTALDTTICSNQSVAIGQIAVAGYSYIWKDINGTLNSTTVSNPIASPDFGTKYTVTVTDDLTGCTSIDTADIIIRNVTANAGPDWLVCDNALISIGTAAQTGVVYQWNPANGPYRNGTDSASAQPELLVTTNLTFNLLATDTLTGCSDRDTVQIVENNNPSIADFLDQNVCLGEPLVIGNAALPGVSYSWNNAADLSCSNCAQPTIINPQTSKTYTVTATFLGNCNSTATDDVAITVNDPSFTISGGTYCPSSGALALNGGPVGMTNYSWAPTALLQDHTIQNPVTVNPPPSTPTIFSLEVTDANGCKATDTAVYTPIIDQPLVAGNQLICLDNSINIGSNNNPIGPGISYSWTPTTGLSSETDRNPTFTPTAVGTYTFIVTKTENGCSINNNVTITVDALNIASLPSVSYCENECVQIGTNTLDDIVYQWSPSTFLNDSNIANPTACASGDITYNFMAINGNGCINQQTVLLKSVGTAPNINISDLAVCSSVVDTTFNPIVSPSGSYSYQWSPAIGLSDENILNPRVFVGIDRSYSFSVINNSNGCSNTEIVDISIIDCQPIPVTLLHWQGQWKNETPLLSWSTATEINNSHFILSRSIDGENFEEIAFINSLAPNGNSNEVLEYSYTDFDMFQTNVQFIYYQLQQVDFDGTIAYHGKISLSTSNHENEDLSLYPNPNNGQFKVAFRNLEESNDYLLKIVNSQGAIIFNEAYYNNKTGVININLNELETGVYYLRVRNGKSEYSKTFIIK